MVSEQPTLPRKQREFHRHRLEILEAAETVFAERGCVTATMCEIAQRAEFSVGTLSKFFRNKADLYATVILEKLDSMADLMYREMESGRTPLEKGRSVSESGWNSSGSTRGFSGPCTTI